MGMRVAGGPSTSSAGGGGGGGVTSVNGDTGPAVTVTPASIGAQPVDSDLTAIAALSTTTFGRSLLELATAGAARTALGLVVGTDVEAHDTDLTTIAGLTPSNDDIIQRKAGAWTNRTMAQLATDLGLASGYQPLDSDLTAIAALTTTSFGRSFLALADAAAGRTLLGLGDISLQNRAALNIGRLNVMGHSWIAGATVSGTGTPYMEMQGMLARVAGMFGIHNDNILNMAQVASCMTQSTNPTTANAYSGWAAALQYLVPSNAVFVNDPATPVITHGPAVPGAHLLVHGLNDIPLNTTSAATQGRNAWKHALRTYFSIGRAGTVYSAKYTNSTFTWDSVFTFSGFAGTVAQTTANLGPAVRTSIVNGDYVELLLPADFRGGTVAMGFVSGKGGYATISVIAGGTGVTSLVMNSTLDYTTFANGDVITIGTGGSAEDVRITSGGGTATIGITATTIAHAAGDVIIHSVGTSKVNWTTSGSNASITGSTQLSGQGYKGTRVAVTKRFACTAADAGKTIRATVAGFAASQTETLQFTGAWIEAELVPPTVVVNIPRFAFNIAYSSVYVAAPDWNADIATVIAEFDTYIKIADIDAVIFGRSGTVKTTVAASTSITVTANTLATFDIQLNDTISIDGSNRRVTAISGPSGSDYTLTLNSAVSATAGRPICNADWFHSDFVHFNGVGHGVMASIIYDTFASLPTTASYQLGNTSATWVQDHRAPNVGIVNGYYLQPQGTLSTQASVLNTVYYYPVDIPEECWITGFAVSTSSAVATANARVGLYDNDYTNGRPGGLLAELGVVACATSGAFAAADVCYLRVRPGRYWTGLKADTAAAVFRSANNASSFKPMYVSSPVAGANFMILYKDSVVAAGAMPAVASPVEDSTRNAPLVWLQLRAAEFG